MQTTPPSGVTQFRLVKYPSGPGFEGIFARTQDALPEMKSGEVHLRLSHISVDPGMRGWGTPKRSYMPPVQPGGVMRAIGAHSRVILLNLISEGVFIGLMSWMISLPLSLPLSYGIGYLIGMMSFRSPLPLMISPVGLVIWITLVLVGSIAASAYPAQQASRLTVRETLAYV